jgi:hypothetical protein
MLVVIAHQNELCCLPDHGHCIHDVGGLLCLRAKHRQEDRVSWYDLRWAGLFAQVSEHVPNSWVYGFLRSYGGERSPRPLKGYAGGRTGFYSSWDCKEVSIREAHHMQVRSV